jgi:hypothetical protein
MLRPIVAAGVAGAGAGAGTAGTAGTDDSGASRVLRLETTCISLGLKRAREMTSKTVARSRSPGDDGDGCADVPAGVTGTCKLGPAWGDVAWDESLATYSLPPLVEGPGWDDDASEGATRSLPGGDDSDGRTLTSRGNAVDVEAEIEAVSEKFPSGVMWPFFFFQQNGEHHHKW